jgi:hypothetical protein
MPMADDATDPRPTDAAERASGQVVADLTRSIEGLQSAIASGDVDARMAALDRAAEALAVARVWLDALEAILQVQRAELAAVRAGEQRRLLTGGERPPAQA